MQTRTLLGFVAMALFTSAPVLMASGCSDDDTGENQGALCSTEGAYSCDNNVLMRCTDGRMTTIEDCGQNECEADAGHCHVEGEHDEHHDHGHDEHHDEHDEHHDEHDEHHDHN